jgi:hypothetical protein
MLLQELPTDTLDLNSSSPGPRPVKPVSANRIGQSQAYRFSCVVFFRSIS